MSEANYKHILQDVRQAWRIVAAYQQRVIHLLSSVEAYFPDLAQIYWEPASYSRPPSKKTKPAAKWTWDGLPYYYTRNWFTLIGTSSASELKPGDWFLVIEVQTDSGFDTGTVRQSASFHGPDPANMPPVEQTSSELYLFAYCVVGEPNDGFSADAVWAADPDYAADADLEKWVSLQGISAKRLYLKKSLVDLFEEDGEAQFFEEVKAYLRQAGARVSE